MSAFSDRVQALMDEVYDEWEKEENKGKSKWEILDGFSEAHQIAVVFGNFNHQVGNGGLEQWIYNGYFHDDAEKLTEYLESGSDLDTRFQTILDRLYKLDQCAQETGCGRYGYFHEADDDKDGDGGFIGDMINCKAFDTWYYKHCGETDWWESVCGIIDQAQEREPAAAGREQPDIKQEKQSVLAQIREAKAAAKSQPQPERKPKSHAKSEPEL